MTQGEKHPFFMLVCTKEYPGFETFFSAKNTDTLVITSIIL
jgi:hypothetical protein